MLDPVFFIMSLLIIVAAVMFALFLLVVVKAGKEGRFFIAENLFRRGGVILEVIHPTGAVEFKHVKTKATALVGKGKVFMFLHKLVGIVKSKGEDTEATEKEMRRYNEVIKSRAFLRGVRKPIFHGVVAASIVSTPKLIQEIETAKRGEDLEDYDDTAQAIITQMGKLGTPNPTGEYLIIEQWNIDTLSEIVNLSYSTQDIAIAEEEAYLKGLGHKPKSDKWKIILPFLLIIVGVLFLVLFMGGYFKDVQIPLLSKPSVAQTQ